MDPNEALRVIRDEIHNWGGGALKGQFDPDRLAEHVEALDEWITKDGALPLAWDSLGGFGRRLPATADSSPF